MSPDDAVDFYRERGCTCLVPEVSVIDDPFIPARFIDVLHEPSCPLYRCDPETP